MRRITTAAIAALSSLSNGVMLWDSLDYSLVDHLSDADAASSNDADYESADGHGGNVQKHLRIISRLLEEGLQSSYASCQFAHFS